MEAGKFCSTVPILGVRGVEFDFCSELIVDVADGLLTDGIAGLLADVIAGLLTDVIAGLLTDVIAGLLTDVIEDGKEPENDLEVFICETGAALVDPGFGPRFCFFTGGINEEKLWPINWR